MGPARLSTSVFAGTVVRGAYKCDEVAASLPASLRTRDECAWYDNGPSRWKEEGAFAVRTPPCRLTAANRRCTVLSTLTTNRLSCCRSSAALEPWLRSLPTMFRSRRAVLVLRLPTIPLIPPLCRLCRLSRRRLARLCRLVGLDLDKSSVASVCQFFRWSPDWKLPVVGGSRTM